MLKLGLLFLGGDASGSVPDVNFNIFNGLAGGVVCDCAVHVRHVAALVFVDDGVSEGSLGSTVTPEGTKNLRVVSKRRTAWSNRGDLTAVAVG